MPYNFFNDIVNDLNYTSRTFLLRNDNVDYKELLETDFNELNPKMFHRSMQDNFKLFSTGNTIYRSNNLFSIPTYFSKDNYNSNYLKNSIDNIF